MIEERYMSQDLRTILEILVDMTETHDLTLFSLESLELLIAAGSINAEWTKEKRNEQSI